MSPSSGQTSLEWRTNDVVEQEGTINQQPEAGNLEPLEGLPSQTQRDKPDEKGSAGVDCAAGCSRDRASDRQAEEVKAAS